MQIEQREIGVDVRGVNLQQASTDDVKALQELLYKHRVIIVKEQDVDEGGFCDVSHRFGEPVAYLQDNYHHPQFPLIFVSSNVVRNGKKMGVARTGGYWHSDTSFQQQPTPLTMLTPRIIPTFKRRTDFIDMSQVWSALPEHLRCTIRGGAAIHTGRWRYKIREQDAGLDIAEILGLIDQAAPPVYHPAVLTHPVTREEILFVSSGFAQALTDDNRQVIPGLLEEVIQFSESGEFTKSVAWDEGDIIIWDNRFLIHKSGRYESPNGDLLDQIEHEEETMMYRIIVNDGYQLSA